jgi:hypothetical protein
MSGMRFHQEVDSKPVFKGLAKLQSFVPTTFRNLPKFAVVWKALTKRHLNENK